MGYTHYWTFRPAPRGQASKTETKYVKALKECTKVIQAYSKVNGGLSGYSAHTSKYGGVNVNGSESSGACESFTLREHFSENTKGPLGNGFDFCKTRQYPYDTVVTACLIILKHRLGDLIDVSSDGDARDWSDGLKLVQRVLGLKTVCIPKGVRQTEAA